MSSPLFSDGEPVNAAKLNSRIINPLNTGLADTGWQTCGAGNPNVSGTARVRRIGNEVFAQLNLSYSGGWNSQVTAFTLPDSSYAPVVTHRMSMGGAIQSTASTIILTCNAGSGTVFAGSNGPAASVQMLWSGSLWLVN